MKKVCAAVLFFCGVAGAALADIDLTGAKTYTVQKGDTLAGIARYHYGVRRAAYFPLILLANKSVVDPDLIAQGSVLVVPDLQRNVARGDTVDTLRKGIIGAADIYERKEQFYQRWDLLALANSLTAGSVVLTEN